MDPASVSSVRRRLSVDGHDIDIDGVGITDMDVEIPHVIMIPSSVSTMDSHKRDSLPTTPTRSIRTGC